MPRFLNNGLGRTFRIPCVAMERLWNLALSLLADLLDLDSWLIASQAYVMEAIPYIIISYWGCRIPHNTGFFPIFIEVDRSS